MPNTRYGWQVHLCSTEVYGCEETKFSGTKDECLDWIRKHYRRLVAGHLGMYYDLYEVARNRYVSYVV